jgi:hypothetical protein
MQLARKWPFRSPLRLIRHLEVMRLPAALVTVAILAACRHAPVPPDSLGPCVSPYPPPPSGIVRIDGPGSFGVHVNDSLIVRVDDRDRWRGVVRSCARPEPGLYIDLPWWRAATDSLELKTLDRVPGVGRSATWLLELVSRKTKG